MRTVKQLAGGRNIAQQGTPARKHPQNYESTGVSFTRNRFNERVG
jgi:hypothetical protein